MSAPSPGDEAAALPADARRRYARQRLLPEIGDGGQRRLLEALVVPAAGAEPRAAAVAVDYLARAGVGAAAASPVGRPPGTPPPALVEAPVPDAPTVRAMTGSAPWLGEAAAAVAGAFAAVEAIKSVVGAGKGGRLDGFSLAAPGPMEPPER